MPIDHDPKDHELEFSENRVSEDQVRYSEDQADETQVGEFVSGFQVEEWIKKVAQEAADRTHALASINHDMDTLESKVDAVLEEEDGLYYKYRVFKEPKGVGDLSHPVRILATWGLGRPPQKVEEVQEFTFTLKPDTDHHARVALAAYAKSVAQEKPRLHDDLMEVLGDF